MAIIEIDTEEYDEGSDFNTGTYKFTALLSRGLLWQKNMVTVMITQT